MKIRKSSLIFKNVISAKIQSNDDEWREDIKDFKELVTKSGIYPVGPVFFKISKEDRYLQNKDYILYIPMNLPIQFKGNDICSFIGDFKLKECLAIKQIDLDDNIEDYYMILSDCAMQNKMKLGDDIYHVYLENYGVEVVDIFVPIVESDYK
ncbi:DUF5085 family protein [Paraclostridium bifermentans]|uniref:DUF5085 family protein n=1 Tax=Paraclostridium bifermentans TaxID=1490 RepID=UPI0018A0309C|nr:DUF5085 family protein [Paraclostridium bifermentans]